MLYIHIYLFVNNYFVLSLLRALATFLILPPRQ